MAGLVRGKKLQGSDKLIDEKKTLKQENAAKNKNREGKGDLH